MVANWVAFLCSVLVTLFLSPFIVHRLGDSRYGIWVLLASVVGYMGLLDVGVRSAVMRYVARYHAIARDRDASEIASAAFVIYTTLGSAAILLSLVAAAFVDKFFHIPHTLVFEARVVLVIGGINVAIVLMSGVYGGVLSALQRFDISSAMDVGILLLRATAIVLLLTAGYGLIALAAVQLACSLIRFSAQIWLGRRLYPQLRLTRHGWGRSQMRAIFGFSVFSSSLHVSRAVVLTADPIVIGAFMPVSAITFFAIGSTLTDYARSIVNGISTTVTPRASAMDARGEHGTLQDVVLRAASLATLIVLPITITFVIRGGSFIGLWMGPSYATRSGQVVAVLAIALSFAAGCQVITSTLIGKNQHRKLAPFAIGEAVINLILSLLLIRQYGILGMALGTMIPSLASSLVVFPQLARRYVGIRPGTLWARVWLRPMAAMVPFAAASALIEAAWKPNTIVIYMLQILAVIPLAALGAWYVAIDTNLRHAILARVRGRARSL